MDVLAYQDHAALEITGATQDRSYPPGRVSFTIVLETLTISTKGVCQLSTLTTQDAHDTTPPYVSPVLDARDPRNLEHADEG